VAVLHAVGEAHSVNYFVLAVATLQFCAAAWATYVSDWKMAVVNAALGVANVVFATMAK
jgi:hypothetical protein